LAVNSRTVDGTKPTRYSLSFVSLGIATSIIDLASNYFYREHLTFINAAQWRQALPVGKTLRIAHRREPAFDGGA
jgi:hypothetical protein